MNSRVDELYKLDKETLDKLLNLFQDFKAFVIDNGKDHITNNAIEIKSEDDLCEYYNTDNVSEMFKRTPRTIYNWCDDGTLNKHTFKRRLYFRKEEVDALYNKIGR